MPPLPLQAASLLLTWLQGTSADSALAGQIVNLIFNNNTSSNHLPTRDCKFGRLAQLRRSLGGHPKLGRRLGSSGAG